MNKLNLVFTINSKLKKKKCDLEIMTSLHIKNTYPSLHIKEKHYRTLIKDQVLVMA